MFRKCVSLMRTGGVLHMFLMMIHTALSLFICNHIRGRPTLALRASRSLVVSVLLVRREEGSNPDGKLLTIRTVELVLGKITKN